MNSNLGAGLAIEIARRLGKDTAAAHVQVISWLQDEKAIVSPIVERFLGELVEEFCIDHPGARE